MLTHTHVGTNTHSASNSARTAAADQPHRNPLPILNLHAGVSKKVGLPGFSSASASCTIEAELDSSLLADTQGFQTVVQRAYQSCEQAVHDQIARLLAQGSHAPASLDAAGNVRHSPSTRTARRRAARTLPTHPGRSRTSPTHQPDAQPDAQPALQPAPQPDVIEVRTSPAVQRAPVSRIPAAQFTSQPSPRPATVSQVKAIRAIASRRKIDLVGLLRERFGLHTADELGIRQASDLIDELKSDGEPVSTAGANGASSGGTNGQTNGHTNGTGTYATNGGAR